MYVSTEAQISAICRPGSRVSNSGLFVEAGRLNQGFINGADCLWLRAIFFGQSFGAVEHGINPVLQPHRNAFRALERGNT